MRGVELCWIWDSDVPAPLLGELEVISNRAEQGSSGSETSHDVWFTKKLQTALQVLERAYHYAKELELSSWDFAVEISSLRRAGLDNADFRWLTCCGYVEHAIETSSIDDDSRTFRSSGRLNFRKKTCFILTDAGSEYVSQLCNADSDWETFESSSDSANGLTSKSRKVIGCEQFSMPQWDCDRREIRYKGQLVKQYKLPSPNQEMILMAFEEEGWPARIDDPLSAKGEQPPKRRLHDTIRSLNRHQKEFLIRFKGDGTGEGILWEPATKPKSENGSGQDGHEQLS